MSEQRLSECPVQTQAEPCVRQRGTKDAKVNSQDIPGSLTGLWTRLATRPEGTSTHNVRHYPDNGKKVDTMGQPTFTGPPDTPLYIGSIATAVCREQGLLCPARLNISLT